MTAIAYVGRWREIYMKLQMVNVTRKFGDFRAVENLNLTIENGVYGLLGVNGAGKTTLMRMICTLCHLQVDGFCAMERIFSKWMENIGICLDTYHRSSDSIRISQ